MLVRVGALHYPAAPKFALTLRVCFSLSSPPSASGGEALLHAVIQVPKVLLLGLWVGRVGAGVTWEIVKGQAR